MMFQLLDKADRTRDGFVAKEMNPMAVEYLLDILMRD